MSKSSIDEVIESLDREFASEDKLGDTQPIEKQQPKSQQRQDFQDQNERMLYDLFKEVVGINVAVHGAENAVLVVEKYLNEGEGYLKAFTSAYNSRVTISHIPPAAMRAMLTRYFQTSLMGEIANYIVYDEILDAKSNLLNMAALATYDKYCTQDDDSQLTVALLDFVKTGQCKKFTNDFGCRELIRQNIQPYEAKVVAGYAASLDSVYNYPTNTIVSDEDLVSSYVDVLKEFKRENAMKQ